MIAFRNPSLNMKCFSHYSSFYSFSALPTLNKKNSVSIHVIYHLDSDIFLVLAV